MTDAPVSARRTWMFAQAPIDETALFAAAAPLAAALPGARPDAACMATWTRDHGIDTASAAAVLALRAEPATAALRQRMQAAPAGTRPESVRFHLRIVPAMFHRERPELGGDGGLAMSIAERLGVPAALVPVRSLGTVDANAAIIRDHLRAEPEPVIWLTHSKATPDTVAALVAEPALAQRIALWISVGGSPGGSLWMEPGIGSPLAHLVRRIWLRVRGGDAGLLEGLRPSVARPRLARLPPVPAISLVAVPARHHLRRPVDRSFAQLAEHGPNDGFVLLADACLPGPVVPLWGADHFLRTHDVPPALDRLISLASSLGGDLCA